MTEEQIIDEIIQREGGFSDRPADKGGPTQFGITKATYEEFIGTKVTLEQFKRECTSYVARVIYEKKYLPPWAWVTDTRLRVLLVDWAVNSWHDDPTKALQRAVGGLVVDGRLGPATRAATLQAIATGRLADIYREVFRLRQEHFVNLALSDTAIRLTLQINKTLQMHNLRGWLNRMSRFV